ncbi:MAG: 5-methyltetrahydropteroyltriglutamate--homocysteine methyltransferase, partial [Xanthobacteraceae bacterium]|nr:5-methyltetrahydropteroyltriglutamate--homocysteine methyltransferase [Xanthobacteraceae bacterium]
LAKVPDDKRVVLGLVTTKSSRLESLDELTHRISDAARYIDPERLAITSQCGFGTTAHSTPMSEQEQEAKLRLIAAAGDQLWRAA